MVRQTAWTVPSLGTLGLGTLCITAALMLWLFQVAGRFDTIVYSTPDTGTAFNVASIFDAESSVIPAANGAAPYEGAAIARLVIPSINVDAPVVVKGIGPDGYMETPNNGYDVAWYDFTASPGGAGNAVFSGHVDYHTMGPAVFWRLGKLESDDLVEIRLEDGSVLQYRVTGKGAFNEDEAPVEKIIGATPMESITLITCTGAFNATTRQYDKRLVVRAERVTAHAPASPDGIGQSR